MALYIIYKDRPCQIWYMFCYTLSEEQILLKLTEMKTLIITSILAVLIATGAEAMVQNRTDDYLGLPGDNLNLYAVMKLFQESETLEAFERSLNDENSRINNLDLNGDNMVDYITVNDYVDGDVHNIVLRTALNRNDNQDVAVFTVQRFRDGAVQIQLIGDEALYGKNYIIEPIDNSNYAETPNPGYTGRPASPTTVVRTTVVFEVAAWPLVRFIYNPGYVVWHSSWYWGYYPVYWNPWRPYYWHFYYGYHYNWHHHYYSHYRHWGHHRYARYNDFYYRGIRAHSPYVRARIRDGHYRYTYSRPELRREGEALYSKTYRRQDTNTSISSQNRRPASQSTRPMTAANNSSPGTRRASGTIDNRSSFNSSAVQNAGTTRRTATTVNSKSGNSSMPVQNANGTRRSSATTGSIASAGNSPVQHTNASRSSSATVSNRSYGNTSQVRSTNVTRRPTSAASSGTYNRPSAVQNAGSARSASSYNSSNRPSVKAAPSQSSSVSRRSQAVVSSRPASKASPYQGNSVSRRSPATVSSRPASKPSAPAKSYSSGSNRQSSVSSGSSSHRSSQASRSGSSAGRSSSSGKSDNSGSSRRR
jgi:hypothetical protein